MCPAWTSAVTAEGQGGRVSLDRKSCRGLRVVSGSAAYQRNAADGKLPHIRHERAWASGPPRAQTCLICAAYGLGARQWQGVHIGGCVRGKSVGATDREWDGWRGSSQLLRVRVTRMFLRLMSACESRV